METAIKHEQGTKEWRRERAGHVTASRLVDVMGTKIARESYAMQLIMERLYEEPADEAFSYSMQWGKDCEPYAKADYQMQRGVLIHESGFVKHPTILWLGASPDGLVGSDGGVEVKSPYTSVVHLRTWKDGMPAEHMPQVQGEMWITQRKWIDFISYDPRARPESLRLYVQRIHRDDAYIARMAEATKSLLAHVRLEVETYRKLGQDALDRVMAANQQNEGVTA